MGPGLYLGQDIPLCMMRISPLHRTLGLVPVMSVMIAFYVRAIACSPAMPSLIGKELAFAKNRCITLRFQAGKEMFEIIGELASLKSSISGIWQCIMICSSPWGLLVLVLCGVSYICPSCRSSAAPHSSLGKMHTLADSSCLGNDCCNRYHQDQPKPWQSIGLQGHLYHPHPHWSSGSSWTPLRCSFFWFQMQLGRLRWWVLLPALIEAPAL